MKRWTMLWLALAAATLPAKDVVLCHVDYSASHELFGQTIPLGAGPFPGRTTCSAINFGTAVIGAAPPALAGTAAILVSGPVNATTNYSQLQFNLFEGGVYAFQKHRIEAVFQWVDPAGFSGGDSFRILMDGGVTYSLNFSPDGKVTLVSHVPRVPPSRPGQTTFQDSPAGTFDPAAPVHVMVETDVAHGSATITVNGTPVTFTGLAQPGLGIRNWEILPGPTAITLNLAEDSGVAGSLALRSFTVTGSDYAGPLLDSAAYPDNPTEVGSVTVPLHVPATGTWQAEFSEDGAAWTPFGASITSASQVESVIFGSLAAPRMMVRLSAIP